MSAWEALRKTPKWKKKLNYALQLSLDKLSMFEEEFAIQQIERAIESNWTGVVFTGTERDYQEWLKLKHGNNQKSNQSSVPLKFGRSSYDAVAFRNSSALFRRCCLLACPEFTVDERNRDFMNELFYISSRDQKN